VKVAAPTRHAVRHREAERRRHAPARRHHAAPQPAQQEVTVQPFRPRLRTATRPAAPVLAFDACKAPGIGLLKAWRHTGFHAVNIYIGGQNRGCAQPGLTEAWVRWVASMGWGIIPTYVGLQAPAPYCPCRTISIPHAAQQGANSAGDAIARAEALGIGPGNPIYFDMEQYQPGPTNTPAVLAFLGAWTRQLHRSGYVSGVYASLDSGIEDLARRYGSNYPEPDDIWFAHWNGLATAYDPGIPAGDWPNHRIHQYTGSQYFTASGAVLSIDADYSDGALVTFSSLS
jgi:hypothetical protein